MPQIAQQIDLTALVAAMQALTQTLGLNAKNMAAILNSGFIAADWYHINGAGTFSVLQTSGTLLSLNINTPSAGAVATIYDSASAVTSPGSLVVAEVDLNPTNAPTEVPMGPGSRGLELNNGLVIVTTGSADITIGSL